LKKDDENWMLVAPLETGADKNTVNSLLSNLTGAKRSRTFENGSEQVADYGLVEPKVRLKVKTEEEEKELWIGNKDFTGNQIYVKFNGSPEVFLTSSLLLNSADKDLKEWRDKKLLTFERNKLREIKIQRPTGPLHLEKKEDDWYLEAPIQERADEGTVGSLLSTLEYGEAEDFVDNEEGQLERYNLQSPTVTVQVREEGEESWSELRLGAKSGENYYAHNPPRPTIFVVKDALFKDSTKELWEFRDKDVVNVEQDEVTQLRVQTEKGEIVLRREDYKWIIESPEEYKDQEALSYKFWYPLDDVEFLSIEDAAPSLPDPQVQLELTLKDGSKRAFEFAQEGDRFWARQTGERRQGTISKESFEKLAFDVEDITD
jgi:hypothetical protein